MLNCEYCDYFKKLHLASESDKITSACEFTGFVFTRDVNDMDIEPPCSNMSYQTYLDRLQNNKNANSNDGILYTKNNNKEIKIGA